MASYRLSASVIKRSTGRSATAAAAYRAGAEVACDRYGETHDYTRRGGVLHSEILAPDNAPSWMRDRGQLWNAVEAVEKRKDAQLAREVQLSLPHELSDDQRREMVRQFAREQFVDRGMIADIAIHAPGREGDQRNHHAHVMLTMRELTGEGFGKKARDWNDSATLEQWRAEWATLQNREFVRLGIAAEVDHRSFADRGIDRQPEQHLGPAASAIERRRQDSRIQAENDNRREANSRRAELHAQAMRLRVEVAAARAGFETRAQEHRAELHAAQDLTRLDQTRKHEAQRDALAARLNDAYAPHMATVQAEMKAAQSRLEATGVRGWLRSITGRQAADQEKAQQLRATLDSAEQRKAEVLGKLEQRQAAEREALETRQAERRERQEQTITRARDMAEETNVARLAEAQKLEARAAPQPRDRDAERRERLLRASAAKPAERSPEAAKGSLSTAHARANQPEAEPEGRDRDAERRARLLRGTAQQDQGQAPGRPEDRQAGGLSAEHSEARRSEAEKPAEDRSEAQEQDRDAERRERLLRTAQKAPEQGKGQGRGGAEMG